ncbi:MAG: ABC transporter ATP-binding protein [Candidatus Thorarchaeota archaeon]
MHPLLRIFKYMDKKTWWAFIVVLFTALLDTGFTLSAPYLTKEIINGLFYSDNFFTRINTLKIWLPIFVVVGLSAAVFRFLQRYINEYVSESIVYVLRNNLYSKIQKQSIDFFDRMETGQLISRGTSDIDAIRRLLSIGLRIFFRAICLYIGIFVIIGLMDWKLLLIFIGFAPIMFIAMFTYARRMRPLMKEIQNKFGDMNNVLAENVYGSRVVRAFAAEKFESEKFEEQNEMYLNMNLRMARLRAYIQTIFPFLLTIGSFLLIFFGGRAIINGTLAGGVGTLVAVNGYLVLLQMPTRFISFAILHYQEGYASMNRIFEVIDMEKRVSEKPDALILPTLTGKIRFKNVVFSYVEGNPPVLNNIDLIIEPGETVAFLGTTGSGKSTIVSLVPRFYDPQEGVVEIDDYNLVDVNLDSLRKQMAIVQQEAFLFARTIKENIAFGKFDASEDEIIRAAKIAQAHDFIMSFPKGYDTEVGERGITLSGGQKQRLTIARALLLNSPILIMDDSSSALDFETESQFQKAVSMLIKGKTTLIVTQRLSTIKFATKLVVMDKGEIVEIGTHKELMALGGLYKHLYETQLIEQDFDFKPLTPEHELIGESITSPELGGSK